MNDAAPTIPWQAAYHHFRKIYPTGGLLIDLVTPPNGHIDHYVVKATAVMGTLPLLSVLVEAPTLLEAETQACTKLFYLLDLPAMAAASESSALPAQSLKRVRPDSPGSHPLDPSAPSRVPQPSPVPSSVPAAAPFSHPNPFTAPDRSPEPLNNELPEPKSQPYRSPGLQEREVIAVPEVDDWSEELAQIDAEVRRLGWSAPQESQYLQEHYGKLSRDHITDYGELLRFLTDLQGKPARSPLGSEPWSPPPQEWNGTANAPHFSSDHSGLPSREEMMNQVMTEIGRIGWSARQGSEYLQRMYQVKTRQELTDRQLQEFLTYLQHYPLS